jgi:hypothetical protein
LPLVTPVTKVAAAAAQTALSPAGAQMAAAAICRMLPQLCLRKLPTALKIGCQKQPRKQ